MGRLAAYAQISCAVNPAWPGGGVWPDTGYGIQEILIVGGGVAGMGSSQSQRDEGP